MPELLDACRSVSLHVKATTFNQMDTTGTPKILQDYYDEKSREAWEGLRKQILENTPSLTLKELMELNKKLKQYSFPAREL